MASPPPRPAALDGGSATVRTLRTDWTVSGHPAGDALLEQIHEFGLRFIAWPCPEAAIAWALWVAHAHFLDHLDSTPRFAIVAPEKQSGKTRVLEITEALVPNPLRSASTTTAVLFRLIGTDHSPTVLLDEADAVWAEKGSNEDLRALVNAGHRRGSMVHRMTGEGSRMKATAFETFAAVALAGIGDLPDTVMDRSVVVRMKRRAPHEQVERWSFRKGTEEGAVIRDRLVAWADSIHELEMPEDDDTVTDRAFDVWEPLFAVADLAGGPWPIAARDACRTLTAAAPTEVSLRVRLLAEIRDVWDDATFMPTATLLRELHDLEDSPWGVAGPYGDRGLTPHALARMLGQYGIKSRHSADKAHRGYYRADLEDPWDRYLPARKPSEASEASGLALPPCRACGLPVDPAVGTDLHPTCIEPSGDLS